MIMAILLIIVFFVVIPLLSEEKGETSPAYQSSPQTTAYTKPAIDPAILNEVLFLENTAINLAKHITSGGSFLRVSVLEWKGQGTIEFYHSFFTNAHIDYAELDEFTSFFSYERSESDKANATLMIINRFGIHNTYPEKTVPYFSRMNLEYETSPMPTLIARKHIPIPAESVSLYLSAILAQITEKWPHLIIEVDMGDIDVSIHNK